MNVRDWAALYIARGWQVVPLVPRTKDCFYPEWPKRVFEVEHFEDDSNIGIKPYGGIVTIDVDSAECVALADQFLPETHAVFGRASKPRAKRIYTSDLDKMRQLIDQDPPSGAEAMLVEVRVGMGFQDMAPPSVHPGGEQLEWVGGRPGEADQVPGELLLRAARHLAVAGCAARHYPAKGKRHQWAMAFSGVLRKLEVTQEDASRIVKAAAQYAQDDEVTGRLTDVRTTYAKGTDGDDTGVAAFRSLSEHAGEKFVQTLRKLLGADATGMSTSKLQALNAKHALLFDRSGKLLLLTETPEDEFQPFRLSSPETITNLYTDTVAVGVRGNNPVLKNVGEVWLRHPNRRQYWGMELAPNGKAHPGYYNLWRGYAVEPKKGDWSLFRQHVNLVAGENEECVRYVLAWFAETVKHPDEPIGTCLAFRGGQGTGKSTFARWFGALFGSHFLHLSSEHSLLGHFNAHLLNTIVVFADEAVWAGGKQGLGQLKRIITEQTLAIERKGLDIINVKNMLHLMVASNEQWFVPKELDDRRFAVFHVSRRRQNDTRFFAAVEHQLFREGGLAALLYDLLEWKDEPNLKILPETAEGAKQRQLTAPTMHQWWHEELQDASLWRVENRHLGDRSAAAGLFKFERDALFERWAEFTENHRHAPGSKQALTTFLESVLPEGFPRTFQQKGTGRRFWAVPDLDTCRKHYTTHVQRGIVWREVELFDGEESEI